MKYKAQPNLHIIDYELGREVFVFDENGFFETNDETLIGWVSKNKPFIEVAEESKTVTCKQCGEVFDNIGSFLAHCKKEHKKG